MDENAQRSLYIASQCPFDEDTELATWRAIFQNNVTTVVVMNKTMEDGVILCSTFWPELTNKKVGPYVVSISVFFFFFFFLKSRYFAYATSDPLRQAFFL